MSNSFVHLEYSTSHPGVERFERVVNAADGLRKGWTATRGLAGVLLAAMVATLVVLADQLMDTWADGHLMAAWLLMWVIGFSAMALLAPTARSLAARVMTGLDGWSQNVARRRADERLWDLARKDSRVMADIQAAASRSEDGNRWRQRRRRRPERARHRDPHAASRDCRPSEAPEPSHLERISVTAAFMPKATAYGGFFFARSFRNLRVCRTIGLCAVARHQGGCP